MEGCVCSTGSWSRLPALGARRAERRAEVVPAGATLSGTRMSCGEAAPDDERARRGYGEPKEFEDQNGPVVRNGWGEPWGDQDGPVVVPVGSSQPPGDRHQLENTDGSDEGYNKRPHERGNRPYDPKQHRAILPSPRCRGQEASAVGSLGGAGNGSVSPGPAVRRGTMSVAKPAVMAGALCCLKTDRRDGRGRLRLVSSSSSFLVSHALTERCFASSTRPPAGSARGRARPRRPGGGSAGRPFRRSGTANRSGSARGTRLGRSGP